MNQFNLPENSGDLEEYIDVLSEHQLNCEKSGKYVEADMAKKRVAELKTELERKKKEDLKNKHMNEKVGVERAHLDEFN